MVVCNSACSGKQPSEPGLHAITILSHRAQAIAACIHGAACLGDDVMLGRLLAALLAIARSPKLGSAQELTHATMRGLVALRRFGGVEPARALLEDLDPAFLLVVGIAGGKRKTAAIRGALAGGWINTLITDRSTAERLIHLRAFGEKPRKRARA